MWTAIGLMVLFFLFIIDQINTNHALESLARQNSTELDKCNGKAGPPPFTIEYGMFDWLPSWGNMASIMAITIFAILVFFLIMWYRRPQQDGDSNTLR